MAAIAAAATSAPAAAASTPPPPPLPSGECGARLGNIAYSVVVAFGLPADGYFRATDLFDAIAAVAPYVMQDFNGQEICMLCWALARANHRDTQLFDLVAERACRMLQRDATTTATTAITAATAATDATDATDATAATDATDATDASFSCETGTQWRRRAAV